MTASDASDAAPLTVRLPPRAVALLTLTVLSHVSPTTASRASVAWPEEVRVLPNFAGPRTSRPLRTAPFAVTVPDSEMLGARSSVMMPGGATPRLPSVWETATLLAPTIERKYVVLPAVPSKTPALFGKIVPPPPSLTNSMTSSPLAVVDDSVRNSPPVRGSIAEAMLTPYPAASETSFVPETVLTVLGTVCTSVCAPAAPRVLRFASIVSNCPAVTLDRSIVTLLPAASETSVCGVATLVASRPYPLAVATIALPAGDVPLYFQ